MRCKRCGAELPARARFCSECGAAASVSPSRRERRLLTALFVDIVGSTPLGEQLDPEHLSDVLVSSWFSAMRDEVEAMGGHIQKFIGDAVSAVFGVPVAHEDDPLRAVRTARSIMRRLEAINREIRGAYGVELTCRIGISTGEAMVVYDDRTGDLMVTGDVMNTAARLEQAATPGQVLVAERTAKSVPQPLVGPAGEVALRGKERPVPVYVLTGEEADEETLPGGDAPPLIGRGYELDTLLATLTETVEKRRAHLVRIFGDPGIGKSRLVTEFVSVARLSTPTPHVLRGRCLPYGDRTTYWALAEVLKTAAGILDSDGRDVAVGKLRAFVGGTLDDPGGEVTSALAWTVGIHDATIDFAALPPRAVQARMRDAWRLLFSGLAEQQPAVIVVEDVHWADTALLDLLEDVCQHVVAPLLVVCPARPEHAAAHPQWGREVPSSTMTLAPLTFDESCALLAHVPEGVDVSEPLRARVVERAEGNPFFLGELVRHIAEQAQHSAASDTAAPVGGPLPDTVQAVLAARIDALDATTRWALQHAAVVGRVFWPGAVAALVGATAAQTECWLDDAVRRELVVSRQASAFADQAEYAFTHALVRDVAEATLPRSARGEAHHRISEWIEVTAADRRPELLELIAHHRTAAHALIASEPRAEPAEVDRRRRAAFESLIAAADQARGKLATEKAVALALQSLSIATDPVEKVTALEVLAEARELQGRGDDAWAAFIEAIDLRLTAIPHDRRTIARLCGRALETPTRWTGTMDELPAESVARRYLEVGLGAAEEGGVEKARLLVGTAFWCQIYPDTEMFSDRDREPREAAAAAAEIAETAGDVDVAMAALDGAFGIALDEGDFAACLALSERRLALVGKCQDPVERSDTHGSAAWALFHVGRYRDAEHHAELGYEAAAGVHSAAALYCAGWAAISRFRQGDWDGFLQLFERCTGLTGDALPFAGAARPWAVAALVHSCRGDHAEAARHRAVVEQVEREDLATSLAHWLARIEAREGLVDDALKRLDLVALRGTTDMNLALEARCDIVGDSARWDLAPDTLRAAKDMAGSGVEALPIFADRLEGRLLHAQRRLPAARRLLARATEGFTRLQAHWEGACTRLYLAQVSLDDGKEATLQLGLARPHIEAARSRAELQLLAELREGRPTSRAVP